MQLSEKRHKGKKNLYNISYKAHLLLGDLTLHSLQPLDRSSSWCYIDKNKFGLMFVTFYLAYCLPTVSSMAKEIYIQMASIPHAAFGNQEQTTML